MTTIDQTEGREQSNARATFVRLWPLALIAVLLPPVGVLIGLGIAVVGILRRENRIASRAMIIFSLLLFALCTLEMVVFAFLAWYNMQDIPE